MFKKHYVIFTLAALLLSASVFAQDNKEKPKEEKPNEKAAEPFFVQPQAAPLTFSFGNESYLGVFLEDVSAARKKELNLTEERGAVIMSVAEGSPAEKAGLKANDVIISFNGERVDSVRKLQRLLGETPAGRVVSFEILRSGSSQTLTATLAKRSQSGNWAFGRNDEATKLFEKEMQRSQADSERFLKKNEELFKHRQELNQGFHWLSPRNGFGNYNFDFRGWGLFGGARLGLMVEPMSEQLADYFGVKEGKGVLVTEVTENSAAAKAGLKAGDVITEVDGQKVTDVNTFINTIARKTEGTLAVRVIRRGDDKTFNVTIEKATPMPTPRPRPVTPRKRALVYSPVYNVV